MKSTNPNTFKHGKHITPALLALLAGDKNDAFPSAESFEAAVQHLATCEQCRHDVSLLTGASHLVDRLAGAPESMAHLDDDTITLFAEARVLDQEAIAAQHHHTQAEHLAICRRCQREVEIAACMLETVREDLLPTGNAAIASTGRNPWHMLPGGTRRLAESYVIAARKLSLNVTSTLPNPRITIVPLGQSLFMDSVAQLQADPTVQTEAHFEVRLPDEAHPDGLLEVEIYLHALFTRRVSGEIRVTNPLEHSPVAGVRWQLLSAPDAPEPVPLRQGETNAEGNAYFFVDPKHFGAYVLALQLTGQRWDIPLIIRAESSN